ncbi:MAG: DUF2274 domain-containing protein [Opitutaceae bacterium]|nr:DUF2274 domain-containing protein [Opitutaceae bacterium]MBL4893334.1 DUF2274 domain-containing protein [Emcibacter sp.]
MLKIGKLPDRKPVKLTISVMPDLYEQIQDYVRVYEVEYGQVETPQNLIPAMLETFIHSDHQFKKSRQKIRRE